MTELGPVGIGLSVTLGAFMVVLGLEIYYIYLSRKRTTVVATSGRALCLEDPEVNIAREKVDILQVTCAHVLTFYEKGRRMAMAGYRRSMCWAKMRAGSPEKVAAVASPVPEPVRDVENLTCELCEEDECDIYSVEELWGVHSRLLFTIVEESNEELEDNDDDAVFEGKAWQTANSTGPASTASAGSSPFHTPPSSPPFATPFGSPDHGLSAPQKPDCISSSSSATTTSSSPRHQSQNPLIGVFEESSSFGLSSATTSSPVTPATLSPSLPAPSMPLPFPAMSASPISLSPRKYCRTLGLLFDTPSSPSSGLYHHHHDQRVHPHPLPRTGCKPIST